MNKKIYILLMVLGIVIFALSMLCILGSAQNPSTAYAAEIEISSVSSQDGQVSATDSSETSVASDSQENESSEAENSEIEISAWTAYIKEKIMPGAVFIVTAIALCWGAISPIVARLLKSINKFKDATDAVTKANETALKSSKDMESNKEETAKAFAEYKEKLAKEFADYKEEVAKALLEMKKNVSDTAILTQNIDKILRIGFGNMEELVKKGYASELLKVGDNNDKKTKKTTDSH